MAARFLEGLGMTFGWGMVGGGVGGEGGWVPAPVFTGAGSLREQRRGELVGQSNVTGDHKGRPYGGKVEC